MLYEAAVSVNGKNLEFKQIHLMCYPWEYFALTNFLGVLLPYAVHYMSDKGKNYVKDIERK